jgi:hypothetical protein
MADLTDDERLQDELILAAIIAGGMASGREVRPASIARPGQVGHDNLFGVGPNDDVSGPCCAVGAGVLFVGVSRTASPTLAFAEAHGVSESYALGVSDGFEGHHSGLYRDLLDQKEWQRGHAVGLAAWGFFVGDSNG